MKRQNIDITLAAVLVFFGLQCPIFAQAQGDAFDQTQIIVGDRTLTVQNAFKISERPTVVEIPITMGELDYQLVPKRPATQISLQGIEPAKIRIREPLEKLYHGFVKAGAGTFATPFAEAFYTSTRHRDLAYGVHAKHISSHDGINLPVAFSGFSKTNFDLWGKKVLSKHSLEAGVGYHLNGYHYYGFDPQDQEIDKKDIRQKFNDLVLRVDLKSYYRDSSKVNHNIGLDSYFYSDRYDAKETGIKATTQWRTWRGDQYYTLDANLDFIGFKANDLHPFNFMNDTSAVFLPAKSYNNVIFNATPRILVAKHGLRAMVGLGIYAQFDAKARFHAFPDVEVSYSLFNAIFVPYAGLTGGVNRNSFKTLSQQNPFILPTPYLTNPDENALHNSVVKYDLYGGIRGTISDKMSFNTRIGYKRIDQTPLFVNDTVVSVENRFSVVYDDVQTFSILGELSYKNATKWTAIARGQLFTYETNDQKEAWHLPGYRFSLLGSYSLFDKFILSTEMAFVGKRYAKSYFPVSDLEIQPGGYYKVEMKPYFDLSLKAEYQYSARLSAFVETHNLTGTKYDVYYRFPVQRVWVMGGLKFSF